MTADLGNDWSCVFDLDFSLTEVSGRRCLAEAVARRWLTRPGALFYDPSYGAGVEGLLHAEIGDDVESLGTGLENEALRDERVREARVTVTREDETLRIVGVLVDDDGPFRLVLDVSQVRVALLLEEAA